MQNEIIKAAAILKNGGIILYPTDTIWGIGCDATNSEAVKKIYQLKQREETKSMLVLVEHVDRIGLPDSVPDAEDHAAGRGQSGRRRDFRPSRRSLHPLHGPLSRHDQTDAGKAEGRGSVIELLWAVEA